MPARQSGTKEYIKHHKDGTVWARGQTVNEVATGYWEWFRKDGTRLRSGHFENGQQVGEWITYDRQGHVYKVTMMKSKTQRKAHSSENATDRYLAALPEDQRVALAKLRSTIHAIAPRAEDCISYQLPAFRLDGKVLVLFGATANHCAFYPGSGTAVKAHEDELHGYKTSKGAIRFQPTKPLPVRLVRKIVKYRIAENAAQQQHAADGATRRHP